MNGTTKQRSHFLLRQQIHLAQSFPLIEHRIGAKVLASIRRREAPPQTMHPCVKTHVSFTNCMRRYADSHDKRCSIQADKHADCLRDHELWKPDEKFEYLSLLEELQVFADARTYKRADPKRSLREGAAALFELTRNP